jgi:hypothetical protein
MRSADVTQSEMFSYRTLEQRIPVSHPLRKLRVLVDGILATLDADFEALGHDLPSEAVSSSWKKQLTTVV